MFVTYSKFSMNPLTSKCSTNFMNNSLSHKMHSFIMDNSLKIIFLDNHELKSSKFIKSEQLRNEPIIMFKQEASPFIYDVLIKYLRTNGLYNNIVSYENDLQSMILKVEAGKGITFTTELSLGSFTKNINLVDFDYDRANVKTDLVLAWRKDYENPSLSLFLDDIVYA